MNTRTVMKILGFGVLNFVVRFVVGGILFVGVKMNPTGAAYGFLLAVTAVIVTYVLLRFVIRPKTIKEAMGVAGVWLLITLFLDIATAKAIVGIPVAYLLSEIQTWTRLVVIVLVAPFTVSKEPGQLHETPITQDETLL